MHTHADLKKISACRVKPFKFIDRDENSVPEKKDLMNEDGLEDVENLYTDMKTDVVGGRYMRIAHSDSFSECCAYTVELPISKHWRLEVKVAKKAEIKNL